MSVSYLPAWSKHDVAKFISRTVPPGEEKHGYDDRIDFIDTLALAIALKEDGKLLLEALRKKMAGSGRELYGRSQPTCARSCA